MSWRLNTGLGEKFCTWNYTLIEEREHITEVVLADASSMLMWTRLLALQARVEIFEHHFGTAARVIETGLSLSRHVGDGPFFINVVIGVASARIMLDQVEDLISQPGAPSLYWSLTALPRPFLGIRKSIANEYKMFEWLLPEMTDLESARSPAEWAARVARIHGRLLKMRASYQPLAKVEPNSNNWAELSDNLADFKKWVLPHAKEYLEARQGKSDDEMILRFFGGRYHELYDDMYKAGYLTISEAEPFYARGWKQLESAKKGPLFIFASLIASIESFHRTEAMLDRKLAMLRVAEALRLHAGVTGRLPDSLDQVKVVPIPFDPCSGKAFGYTLKGETAELAGLMPAGRKALG